MYRSLRNLSSLLHNASKATICLILLIVSNQAIYPIKCPARRPPTKAIKAEL